LQPPAPLNHHRWHVYPPKGLSAAVVAAEVCDAWQRHRCFD